MFLKNRQQARLRLEVEALEVRTVPALFLTGDAYDPAHVLVQLNPGADASVLPSGALIVDTISAESNLFLVSQPVGWDVEKMLSALEDNPFVSLSQPDYEVSIEQVPDDESFGLQWDMLNIGQGGGLAGADMHATAAWDTTTGSGGTIVAVIDTGIDYTHPDLAPNMWINTGEIPGNNIDDDKDGFIDDVHGVNFIVNSGNPMDDHSHGTHVAGTIGAVGNNGIGVAGVNWRVQLMALKFLDSSGSGSTSNAIRALNYAVAHGASISNNSWGGGGYNQALIDAINNARGQGHIYVAAAGNTGANNDVSPFYPSSYTPNNIVAVAATDSWDQLASFSNYGATTVDLAAPGVNIYSTMPGGNYGYKSGTSMAAPHVAGALALVRDLHPSWTYLQVINQVLGTVDPQSSLTGKLVTGGRLNLAEAIGTPAAPSLNISNVSQAEGNAGAVNFIFTVTLSAASEQEVTVDYATQDGAATASTGDYQSASDTLTFLPGETSKTIVVVVNGDTAVEPSEAFTINLSNPTNATISDSQGIGTIVNDDIMPTLNISGASGAEGNVDTTSFVFTVTLSIAASETVTVNFATADETATVAGGDYQSRQGTLTFEPGETSKSITVLVNGDTLVEANETFLVKLSGASGAAVNLSQATGSITNDDSPPPSLSIGRANVIEGDDGATMAVFTVTLSAASTNTVTVSYSTVNGIATASSDYIAATSALTFAPGETSKSISIAVLGDAEVESDESFFVNLSGAANATIANAQGTGVIRNDDTSISIAGVTKPLANNGNTNFDFTVTLAQPSAKTVTVKYATANGTLSSPNGFNATSGTLTFAPGVTSLTISVKAKKGSVGQYFFVNLSNPTNAALMVSQVRGTIGSNSGGGAEFQSVNSPTTKPKVAATHTVKRAFTGRLAPRNFQALKKKK